MILSTNMALYSVKSDGISENLIYRTYVSRSKFCSLSPLKNEAEIFASRRVPAVFDFKSAFHDSFNDTSGHPIDPIL